MSAPKGPSAADMKLLRKCKALMAYAKRVGAEPKNFRRFEIIDDSGRYPKSIANIRIKDDGTVVCSVKAFAPDKEEAEAIEAELVGVKFPKPVAARSLAKLKPLLKGKEFLFKDAAGGILFVQERRMFKDGSKAYLPWTYFSDGSWRQMEPDALPIFNGDKIKDGGRLMLHEGAKAARRVEEMCADPKCDHPWISELRRYTHLGWPGGAYRAHSVDWDPLKKATGRRIIVVADNDAAGVDAVSSISSMLRCPLQAIVFNDRFPAAFDLADDWPDHPEWWSSKHYGGPSIEDLTKPATWATEIIPKEGKGRPGYRVRDQFAAEWLWVETPPYFVNRYVAGRLLTDRDFNRAVRPFSNVDDVAKLLTRRFSSQVSGIVYRPFRRGERAKVINVDGESKVNTYKPSNIGPEPGDAGPFLEFMAHLIVEESDRHEVLRWCATLIARPDIRMKYAILLISEEQGVGKSTLGSAILAPLVGRHNASFPEEIQITDQKFNGWAAYRTLAVIEEIYGGQKRKTYDKLKKYVTDTRFDYEQKGVDAFSLDLHLHIFACSNSLQAIHLDDADRRFFVPLVTEETRPESYWTGLHRWLDGGGLQIIAQWAEDFLKDEENIVRSAHAPMSARKAEIVAESRSEGQQIAFDLAQEYAAAEGKVVLTVGNVRSAIAHRREMELKDYRLEKPATIRKALKAGGLMDPVRAPGEEMRRYTVNGRSEYVVANFRIEPGVEWPEIAGFWVDVDKM